MSKDFCDYLCANVVTSFNVWQNILDGPKTEAFRSILSRNVPLPSSYIQSIISHLKGSLAVLSPQQHSLHGYVDTALGLKTVLLHKMSLLSTAEFERILHPVFEEDELTLILSGAVLGALSGLLQIWANKWGERREKEKLKKLQLFQENPTNVVS